MGLEALYLICFLISFCVLLYIIHNQETYSSSQIMFMIIMVVGNGGYFALSQVESLPEALLAHKLSYVIGIFAPILLFFTVCDICLITIKSWLRTVLFLFQILLFFCVCTIGKYPIYYKTVGLRFANGLPVLEKTYAPLHSVYIFTMLAYLLAVIVVAVISSKNKSRLFAHDINAIIVLEFITIASYLVERFIHIDVELFPIVDTIYLIYTLYPIAKIKTFSVTGNTNIVNSKLNSFGYILIDKKLNFMGCNDIAANVFPELLDWTMEKRIPGSGGRFNTYLRQPLIAYINSDSLEPQVGRPFEIKGARYSMTFNVIKNNSGRHKGYIIEITPETEVKEV